MRKKTFIVLGCCVVVGAAAGLGASFVRDNTVHEVVLTKQGFEPRELRIRLGEMVRFKTMRKEPFWPASDYHPQHTIYPEFDPGKRIDPDDSWEVRFEKAGTWSYHDHLSANDRGTIVVGDRGSETGSGSVTADDCRSTTGEAERSRCFDQLMDHTLAKNGVSAGLELAKQLYGTDPTFNPLCHALMHRVGAKAYLLFAKSEGVPITPDTALCEYGFYHGFAEELAKTDGDPSVAARFCELATRSLGTELIELSSRCYHGFGHGSVEIDDKAFWGNERAMVAPAIAFCRMVADTPDRLFQCATGAFDAIGIAYFAGEYDLQMNEQDPFWLCRGEENDNIRRGCYVSLEPALLLTTKLDFLRAARFVEAIAGRDDATFVMGSLALPVFWIENQSGKEAAQTMRSWYLSDGVRACRSLAPHLRLSCIQSIAYALGVHEVQSQNYRDSLAFCRSNNLSLEERSICLASTWNAVRHMYPRSAVREICLTEGREEDQQHCGSG